MILLQFFDDKIGDCELNLAGNDIFFDLAYFKRGMPIEVVSFGNFWLFALILLAFIDHPL